MTSNYAAYLRAGRNLGQISQVCWTEESYEEDNW